MYSASIFRRALIGLPLLFAAFAPAEAFAASATSTSLSAAPDPATYGDTVTLKSAVESADGRATGLVSFTRDGAVALGSAGLATDLFTALAAGDSHSCGVTNSGAVQCWGWNGDGQLGDGTTVEHRTPTTIITSGATAIAAGWSHTCALVGDAVQCWGDNSFSQIGDGTSGGDSLTPTTVIASGASAIAAGGWHTCAVVGGGVQCWGDNSNGAVGDNTTDDRNAPVATSIASGATAVAAGWFHSCAIVSGAVKCWGGNGSGQVGDATNDERHVPTATNITSGATAIAAGSGHSCAIVGGAARCWGENTNGQLGDGTTTSRNAPVEVIASGATAIAGGEQHSCAVVSGAVQCWGRNNVGTVGDDTTTQRTTPTATGIASLATAVATGGNHSCAVVNGLVQCWGYNSSGQLGDDSTFDRLVPTPATVFATVTAIAEGSFHTCVLTSGGAVQCWGHNNFGQLGDNTTVDRHFPVQVIASGATALAAGAGHTCAIVSGAVQCWGRNVYGQVGDGTTTQRDAPVATSILSGATAIAAGGTHSCAIVGGAVQCWGRNDSGRLGDGTTTQSSAPVATSIVSGATAIAAGSSHTCAVVSGAAQCWGSNGAGQVGDGTTDERHSPVEVIASGVTAITTGYGNTCAVVSGALQCWGVSQYGQVGDGTTIERHTPVEIIASGVTAVNADAYHACAIVSGALQCWGLNSRGQIGDGTLTQRDAPVEVIASGATLIEAGGNYTCAVAGGALQCWGANDWGQVSGNHYVPVAAVRTRAIATLGVTTLPPGSRTVTASYPGDGSFDASASAGVGLTVNQATSATALETSDSTTVFGEDVTFTATVTSGAGTPTGTVTFKDGGSTIGSDSLSGGEATLAVSSLSVAGHTITAEYAGDGNFTGSASSGVSQTVSKAATTTAVGTSGSPSTVGEEVTFTATVSVTAPGAGTPSGTVTFKDGGATLGSNTLSGGVATLAVSSLAVGGHTITAEYAGDGNFTGSASPGLSQTVDEAATNTAVISSQDPAAFGEEVTFTATVTSGAGTPTGTVIFKDGGVEIGSDTLDGSGEATLAISSLSVGGHTITAEYAGDGSLAGSTSSNLAQTVDKAATTTGLTASKSTVLPGANVRLRATIGVTAPATGDPTGKLRFKEGSETLDVQTVNGGTVILDTKTLTIGEHKIRAIFGNSASFSNSTSAEVTVTVDPSVGKEFRVNTRTARAQLRSSVAALGDGGYIAVWDSDRQDGSKQGIYAQLYKANGKRAGKEFRVNTKTANAQGFPVVAAISGGRFVVAWMSTNQDRSSTGIYAQGFAGNGTRLGREFRVNATTKGPQSLPAIAALKGGGFVVAWMSADGSGLGVFAQRYKANGARVGPQFLVNQRRPRSQLLPSVAGLDNGGFVIAWVSDRQDGSKLGIYARRYKANGGTQGSEFVVNSTSAGAQTMPSAAGLKGGSFVIAWVSDQDGSGSGVFAQRYRSNGTRQGTEFRINATVARPQTDPFLAGFPDGGFFAAWASDRQDGSGWGVHGQRYDADGKPADAEFGINSWTNSDQTQPAVATDTSGGIFAVWTSLNQDGSLQGVYGQRFDLR